MNKLTTLAAAFVVVSAGATAAFAAESTTQKYELTGEREKICEISFENEFGVPSGVTLTDLNSDITTIDFGDVVDDTSLFDGTGVFGIGYSLSCNYTWTLSVRSKRGGFTNLDFASSAPSGDFATCIKYQTRVDLASFGAGGEIELDSPCDDSVKNASRVFSPLNDTLEVGFRNFEQNGGDAGSIAGGPYRDTVTVKVGAPL